MWIWLLRSSGMKEEDHTMAHHTMNSGAVSRLRLMIYGRINNSVRSCLSSVGALRRARDVVRNFEGDASRFSTEAMF